MTSPTPSDGLPADDCTPSDHLPQPSDKRTAREVLAGIDPADLPDWDNHDPDTYVGTGGD